ncbi:hypothetical protein [Pontibacter ruber]|uniref:Uncharacterized protein n=1 Tax=Pontibacter ruber TaxID=1343895 RepID=A0ABW5D3L1_9BACT|nr:hypothetical protein [Pontibacter ruber]
MKIITNLKVTGLILLIGACITACEPDTRQEANRDVQELKAWVDQNSKRAETATQEEWNEMKEEYNQQTAELEKKSAEWDEDAKKEWEQLKTRWNETENKAEARLRNDEGAAFENDTIN